MKHIITFSAGFFIGIGVLGILLIKQEGVPTSSSKWASDLYQAKEAHARSRRENKLLIVSGSNSLFGIYSLLLEQKLGIPVTNFGVHAGLGLGYILDRSKSSLREGDTVYLPLEYSLYQQSSTPSAQLMDFLLARDPKYLHSLPLTEQFFGYANVSLGRIFQGLSGGSDEYRGRSAKVYNINNIDESGNQINNTLEKSSSYAHKLETLKPKDIGDGNISEYSKYLLQRYVKWAENNGICVIAGPPGLMKFKEYESHEFKIFLKKILNFYNELGVVFAGTPSEYLLHRNLFFDTEYHLHEEGVIIRTKMIIEDLGSNLSVHCE